MILFLDFDGVLNSRDQRDDDAVHSFTQAPFIAAWLHAWPVEALDRHAAQAGLTRARLPAFGSVTKT